MMLYREAKGSFAAANDARKNIRVNRGEIIATVARDILSEKFGANHPWAELQAKNRVTAYLRANGLTDKPVTEMESAYDIARAIWDAGLSYAISAANSAQDDAKAAKPKRGARIATGVTKLLPKMPARPIWLEPSTDRNARRGKEQKLITPDTEARANEVSRERFAESMLKKAIIENSARPKSEQIPQLVNLDAEDLKANTEEIAGQLQRICEARLDILRTQLAGEYPQSGQYTRADFVQHAIVEHWHLTTNNYSAVEFLSKGLGMPSPNDQHPRNKNYVAVLINERVRSAMAGLHTERATQPNPAQQKAIDAARHELEVTYNRLAEDLAHPQQDAWVAMERTLKTIEAAEKRARDAIYNVFYPAA